jgi:hypothetical protein
MPIDVQCPNCSATLRAPDAAAGKKVKCPKCEAIIPVQAAGVDNGGIRPAPQPPAPEPPLEMATARAPSRRRQEYEERPERKDRDEDFDGDDRPLRRGPRRDAHETESSGTLPLVLGIISIVFSVMAIPLSFMGCCPPIAFIAAGLAVLGLLLGGGGLVAAFVQKRGMPCPIIGMVLSVIALGIVLAWGLVWGGFYMEGKKQAAQQQEANKKFWDEQKKKDDEEKKLKDKSKDKEYNPNDPLAAKWRQQSNMNLKQLALGMHIYHDKYKSFPAQKGTAPPQKGKGPPKTNNMSWRVAILPFIEQQELYDKFKHNEPWDSPHNKKVLDENPMPAVFASPLAEDGTKLTYYQIIVGPKTPWPNNQARPRFTDFTDGTSNTFLIVEGKTAVYWTKPEDVTFNGIDVPPLGGIFAGEFNAAAADGSVGWYYNKFRPDQIIARITASGGEKIDQFPD